MASIPGFAEVSPQLGTIDEDALLSLQRSDPDAALGLLAEMAGATDVQLRRLALRLAGRVVLRLAGGGTTTRRGIGHLHTQRLAPGMDIDIEASLDPLLTARSARHPASIDELNGRSWTKPASAVCLVIDRSGSMGGRRLATAALATAAIAARADADADYSVLSFASTVTTVKDQRQLRPTAQVIDEVLSLRGHGTTNLELALRAAHAQLAQSSATRKAVLLLSDGRVTAGEDPAALARKFDSFLVLSPTGGAESGAEAKALARAAGGRFVGVEYPHLIPEAVSALWPN